MVHASDVYLIISFYSLPREKERPSSKISTARQGRRFLGSLESGTTLSFIVERVYHRERITMHNTPRCCITAMIHTCSHDSLSYLVFFSLSLSFFGRRGNHTLLFVDCARIVTCNDDVRYRDERSLPHRDILLRVRESIKFEHFFGWENRRFRDDCD